MILHDGAKRADLRRRHGRQLRRLRIGEHEQAVRDDPEPVLAVRVEKAQRAGVEPLRGIEAPDLAVAPAQHAALGRNPQRARRGLSHRDCVAELTVQSRRRAKPAAGLCLDDPAGTRPDPKTIGCVDEQTSNFRGRDAGGRCVRAQVAVAEAPEAAHRRANPDFSRARRRDRRYRDPVEAHALERPVEIPDQPALRADPERARAIGVERTNEIVGQRRRGGRAIGGHPDAVEARQAALGADPDVAIARLDNRGGAVVRQPVGHAERREGVVRSGHGPLRRGHADGAGQRRAEDDERAPSRPRHASARDRVVWRWSHLTVRSRQRARSGQRSVRKTAGIRHRTGGSASIRTLVRPIVCAQPAGAEEVAP